ncbi:MAG: hypothetical protein AAFV29_06845, partial [Myxococcota bacterium]
MDIDVEAAVDASLERLDFVARYAWQPATDRDALVVAKVADHAWAIETPVPPAAEPQLFPSGFTYGGFGPLRITIDGQPCRPEQQVGADGLPLIICKGAFAGGRVVDVRINGRLNIPERYGPFGRHHRQLTLLGGWLPALGRASRPPATGSIRARVTIPPEVAAVLGGEYRASIPGGGARQIEAK